MNNNNFISNMPDVAASITQPLKKAVVNTEDIKRAFDAIISAFASASPDAYAKINAVYKTAQMHGRICNAESLLASFTECCKQNANIADKLTTDKLCKNILNTFECINLMQKIDQQLLIAMILGYAYSIVYEKSS